MIPSDALQVILISHDDGKDQGDFPTPQNYIKKIKGAFLDQESNDLIRELSLSEIQGTGCALRTFFVDGLLRAISLPDIATEIDKALHTLVVVLITPQLIRDAASIAILEAAAIKIHHNKSHDLILIGTSESTLSDFRKKTKTRELGDRQAISAEKLGEYALRPDYAAILALSRAHRLLFAGESLPTKPCFFISHAKLDGLPLAHSLEHVIEKLPWLDSFYDAKDIEPGDDFKEVLERGVLGSMLLILRSDIYDLRFWCRQEIMWAEAYDRPALMVDARTELLSRPSALGYSGIPGVRIPDGNLIRVLIAGLREWVRIGIIKRRYTEILELNSKYSNTTRLLSRPPTLTSVAEALENLKKANHPSADIQIIYADPPLESNYLDSANFFVKGHFPNGELISMKAFIAQIP